NGSLTDIKPTQIDHCPSRHSQVLWSNTDNVATTPHAATFMSFARKHSLSMCNEGGGEPTKTKHEVDNDDRQFRRYAKWLSYRNSMMVMLYSSFKMTAFKFLPAYAINYTTTRDARVLGC